MYWIVPHNGLVSRIFFDRLFQAHFIVLRFEAEVAGEDHQPH